MVTFDELRRRYEDGEGRQEQTKQRQKEQEETRRKTAEAAEAARNTAEAQKTQRIKDQRTKIEEELWGTPERIYATWEHRMRRLLDLERALAPELRRESEEAMRRYGDSNFSAYRKVENIFELFFPAGGNFVWVGSVSASKLSYRKARLAH